MRERNGFGIAFGRELLRITRRPLYWVVCLGLPLFCAVFMSSIFGSGRMTKLPIGIVDQDFTSTSRAITRAIGASPALNIRHRYPTASEALAALKSGQIYGYVVLPNGLEQKIKTNRNPTIAYYCQYALLSVGAQIESTLQLIIGTISAEPLVETAISLGIRPSVVEALVLPIAAESHPLSNPSLSYTLYLGAPFFFVMLQIVVLLLTVYSIGSEISSGSATEWLASANGGIGRAVAAKLLPHALILTGSTVGSIFILRLGGALAEGIEIPRLIVWTILLIVSSQALGLFILSLYPLLGIVMSVASMIGSLGATLCGVTFPLGSMAPIVDKLALLLPIRHFTLLLQGAQSGTTSIEIQWIHIAALICFCILPLPLLPRLHKAINSHHYEKIG